MGVHCQAFADDVVLVLHGNTALQIETKASVVLERVREWGVTNKLTFAPHKTMAMTLTRKLKFDTPRLSMGGVDIDMVNKIKILGLTIDSKLTFNDHVGVVCRKALNLYKMLSKAAKVQWGLGPEIVRLIYTAVVEPIIMYAASVWADATRKLGVKKQLDVVQRGFAQKTVKAYKTVSLNSALLLAGLLPLDIRVREAALLYEVKKGYSQQVIGDREMERPLPFVLSPHPADKKDFKFSCVMDAATLIELEKDSLQIYTDGSRIEGKVGAALSVWRDNTEVFNRKIKLDQCCTVYQAELLALREATSHALMTQDKLVNIFSDSRSALETVVGNDSLNPLALDTRANVRRMEEDGRSLQLFWIKAHAGLEGNERADHLAKMAALKIKTKAFYDKCPVSFVKRQIRLESLDEWNQRYKTSETASTTKVFFPDAVTAYKTTTKMKVDPYLTQVLTGHGGFSSYLHRFKCKESPVCPCDDSTEESSLHVILECPIYNYDRYNLEQEINVNIDRNNLAKIVSDNECRDKFIDYCKLVCKKVANRNSTK